MLTVFLHEQEKALSWKDLEGVTPTQPSGGLPGGVFQEERDLSRLVALLDSGNGCQSGSGVSLPVFAD
jgi:hypothetical protein